MSHQHFFSLLQHVKSQESRASSGHVCCGHWSLAAFCCQNNSMLMCFVTVDQTSTFLLTSFVFCCIIFFVEIKPKSAFSSLIGNSNLNKNTMLQRLVVSSRSAARRFNQSAFNRVSVRWSGRSVRQFSEERASTTIGGREARPVGTRNDALAVLLNLFDCVFHCAVESVVSGRTENGGTT